MSEVKQMVRDIQNKKIPKMDSIGTKPIPVQDINVDSDDTIENMFRQEQNANMNDVKELFHEDKVKARTDLSPRLINNVTKAYYLAKITGMKEIHSLLNDFLTLRISKDRKSRAEFVDGLKARLDNGVAQNSLNLRQGFGK